jgi:putative ABC transport system substrate-binding protein
MNNRRKLLLALGAGALAAPFASFASFAQQSRNILRIGLLWIKGDGSSQYVAAFREGLGTLGYVEDKNVRIDDRSLVDRYERLPEAAGRLVSQKVDVIVCYGATAMQAASKATSTIPIVVVSGGDPVKLGVAASLSRPGGNVTGLTSISQELSGKRLELLTEMVPGMRRLAVILYPGSPAEVASLKSYEVSARALNLEVRPVEVRAPGEIAPAIAGISRMDVQAIAVVGSTLLSANTKQVVAAIKKVRLPAIYANSDFPQAGGLLAYAPNLSVGFRRAATYVDKILKGAKPGDIPIEQPTIFELVVNMKTAKALSIKIPNSILLRADKVIE